MASQGALTYGIVIRVQDLQALKDFYRDTVALGNPIADSNVWVEFLLPGSGILVLEHITQAQPSEPSAQRLAWLLNVKDFDSEVQRLQQCEVSLVHPPLEVPGRKTATFADPEGNPFTICSFT